MEFYVTFGIVVAAVAYMAVLPKLRDLWAPDPDIPDKAGVCMSPSACMFLVRLAILLAFPVMVALWPVAVLVLIGLKLRDMLRGIHEAGGPL